MLKSCLSKVAVCALCASVVWPAAAQINPNSPVLDEAVTQAFERVNPPDPVIVTVPVAVDYMTDLQAALQFHNFMKQIDDQKAKADEYKNALLERNLNQRRLEDLDACNVKLLGSYFSNPEQVWSKMKQQAKQMYQDYTLSSLADVNEISTEEAIALAADELAAGELSATALETDVSDADMAENVVNWDIGRSILLDLYTNQDAWGVRLSKSAPSSLPLWEDQAYVYDEEVWEPKYDAINAYYGVKSGSPKVSDAVKHDYYFHDDVVSAHNQYLAEMTAKTGKPVPPAPLGSVPDAPPKPLPPVDEIVMLLSNNDVFTSVYPSYPEPWQKFIDSGFTMYNKSGEMASKFKVSNGTITPKKVSDGVSANRISVMFVEESDLENSEIIVDEYKKARDTLKSTVESFALANGVELPNDLNYFDKDDLEKVRDILAQGKADHLAKAKELMGSKAEIQNPTAEQLENDEDLALLKALEYDEDAEAMITSINAPKIEEAVKEAKAQTKLMEQVNKNANNLKLKEMKQRAQTLDKQCLNGGITGKFDFNHVTME